MFSGDETGGLVADYGTHSSKFGFAGEDCPRVVRRTRHSFEQEFDSAMSEICSTIDRSDHPIIFTVPTALSEKEKLKWTAKTLESGTSAVFALRSPVAAAFASGKSTAMVVEVGASGVTVCPVYEGYSLLRSVRQSDSLGGAELSKLLSKSLQAQLKIPSGNSSSGAVQQYSDRIDDIKHCCCQVFKKTVFEKSSLIPDKSRDEYALPDGKIIKLGTSRIELCETMFDRDAGLGSLVYASLEACEPDLRRIFAQEIIVVGGGSLLEGFPERLGADVAERVPQSFRPKVYAPGSNIERRFAPFVGCSIVASLGSFQQLWLSKKEWEESGERIAIERFNQ